MIILTIIAISFQLIFYKSLEITMMLIIIDFMILWSYTELEKNKNDKEKSNLLIKIESLERLTSDLFDKITKRFSNKKNDKKELVEWLNKF
jgi:hypothetical protein